MADDKADATPPDEPTPDQSGAESKPEDRAEAVESSSVPDAIDEQGAPEATSPDPGKSDEADEAEQPAQPSARPEESGTSDSEPEEPRGAAASGPEEPGAEPDAVKPPGQPEPEVGAAEPRSAASPGEPEPEPAAASGPPEPAGATPRRGWLVAGAAGAALLAVLGITAGMFFWTKYDDRKSLDNAREDARLAMCAYGKTLTTYDYTNLDPYFKGVLDGATGDFKSLFKGTSENMKQLLVDYQVKMRTQRVDCGVESGDEHRVKVVMVAGQIGSNVNTHGQEQPTRTAMVVTAVKEDGRWWAEKVAGTSPFP